jgi:hypothetical protein
MDETDDWPRFGRLQVDPRLFESRTIERCRIEECRASCCGHGVYDDRDNAYRVLAAADEIARFLTHEPQPRERWFDPTIHPDTDYPSGLRRGTRTIRDPHHSAGTRCVFLREDNFCAIQAMSLARGEHPWALKPHYCALYPLIVLGDRLLLDDENELMRTGGTCSRPSAVARPLYEIYDVEMVLALGQEAYEELRRYAASLGATQ